ncbi:MAG: leucyl aminopeptidase family protein, partial [Rhizobiales bacterium]|nr:leucyl aminopeptidase family protein [Hyphomicrobiales bacterium]
MVDMATLTGAARVALGPDLPPFYTHDDEVAAALAGHARSQADPVWRMPLWPRYDKWINGKVGDISNAPEKPMAGSITAALFLSRFVEKAHTHLHFDVYAWTPQSLPHAPRGGAAQAIRALFSLIGDRYGT